MTSCPICSKNSSICCREPAPNHSKEQLRALRIEAICDCGDDNCASFATAPEVKVASIVELQSIEGHLIIDLNAAEQICFLEILGRPDVRYLIEEYYDAMK